MPATLDLAERAELALRAMVGLADPAAEHEVFWWAHLYAQPPRMSHNGDYFILAEFMEAVPLLRTMTGNRDGEEVDRAWAALVLKSIGPDGLLYVSNEGRPWEPGAGVVRRGNPWTCGRMMGAMTALYLRSGKDAMWGDALKKMTDRLAELVVEKDDYAYFPSYGFSPDAKRLEGVPQQGLSATYTAWALQGLAQFYRASGYEPAGRLARRLALFLKDHADIYDAKGRYLYSQQELDGLKAWKHEPQTNPERLGGHHHHHSIGVLAIADYAAAVGDKELLSWAAASYEWARDHESASKTVGFFAEYLQRDYPSAETCEIADMLGLAVKLSAAGAGGYWDDVDRYLRNQFVENQLTRHDWLERLPAAMREADAPPTPGESRDRVSERNVGTFSGWATANEWTRVGQLMHCCVGNAGRALYYVWEHCVTHSDGILRVNLLLNRASPWADVQSHIPFAGKVEITVKSSLKELLIRAPEWLRSGSEEAACSVNGGVRPLLWQGRYFGVGEVKAGDVVAITFPIAERVVRERIGGLDCTLIIKGSTVVKMEPSGTLNPLYQREHYRQNETLWVRKRLFIADSVLEW